MEREFHLQRTTIDHSLLQMAKRGEEFLDETLRFGRLLDLLRSEKVRNDFEKIVVSDTSTKIEKQVSDIIDIILQKNAKMWAVHTSLLP